VKRGLMVSIEDETVKKLKHIAIDENSILMKLVQSILDDYVKKYAKGA
jgi:hypothetical protein